MGTTMVGGGGYEEDGPLGGLKVMEEDIEVTVPTGDLGAKPRSEVALLGRRDLRHRI